MSQVRWQAVPQTRSGCRLCFIIRWRIVGWVVDVSIMTCIECMWSECLLTMTQHYISLLHVVPWRIEGWVDVVSVCVLIRTTTQRYTLLQHWNAQRSLNFLLMPVLKSTFSTGSVFCRRQSVIISIKLVLWLLSTAVAASAGLWCPMSWHTESTAVHLMSVCQPVDCPMSWHTESTVVHLMSVCQLVDSLSVTCHDIQNQLLCIWCQYVSWWTACQVFVFIVNIASKEVKRGFI